MMGNRNIISISGTVACNQVSNEVLMQNNLKRIKMSTNLKRIHHSRSYKWIYYYEVFFNVTLKQNTSYFMLLKECFGCKWNKNQLFIIYFTRNAIIFITKGDRFIKPPHSESIPKFFLEIPEPMIIQKSWEKVRKNDLFFIRPNKNDFLRDWFEGKLIIFHSIGYRWGEIVCHVRPTNWMLFVTSIPKFFFRFSPRYY